MDHALTELDREGDGRVGASSRRGRLGTQVGLWAGRDYRWLQVFTGDPLEPERRRKAVAAGPMTCLPNAFVTGDDLLVHQPVDAVVHTWAFRYSPGSFLLPERSWFVEPRRSGPQEPGPTGMGCNGFRGYPPRESRCRRCCRRCWPRPIADDDSDPDPRKRRSAIICPVTTSRAVSVLAVMSPKPTVENTVAVKYSASARVSGVLKLWGPAWP
jgi:hypothetical protein